MARRNFVGIYKPRKAINGGAVVQVKLGSQKDCMFLEMAPQVRPMDDSKPYDWDNSRITLKLGPTDIGKLLALFNGNWPLQDGSGPDLELFHKNKKGNKVLKIKKQDRGYYLQVSCREDGQSLSVAAPISWDEAELVRLALEHGYKISLGWVN